MSEATFTRWVDPTIEEKDKEIEELKIIIENLSMELISIYTSDFGDTYEEAVNYVKNIIGDDSDE